MTDAAENIETAAAEAKEVAVEVVSSGLWKKYKAVRVGVFVLVGAATAGSFAYGYLHQAAAAAPPVQYETAQAHKADFDSLRSELPDAVAKKVLEGLKGRR